MRLAGIWVGQIDEQPTHTATGYAPLADCSADHGITPARLCWRWLEGFRTSASLQRQHHLVCGEYADLPPCGRACSDDWRHTRFGHISQFLIEPVALVFCDGTDPVIHQEHL